MGARIILVGHPGSQKIVPASKYLTGKYLPGFDITYLNYKGEINGWGRYVANFLEFLTDDYVIFALDDYLISDFMDADKYWQAEEEIGEIGEVGGKVVCIKLCYCTPEENEEYPITTQYSLWDRKYLIKLLRKHLDPWRFEVHGSKELDGIAYNIPCIPYFTNSSLSSRWEGIELEGVKKSDIKYLKENNLL